MEHRQLRWATIEMLLDMACENHISISERISEIVHRLDPERSGPRVETVLRGALETSLLYGERCVEANQVHRQMSATAAVDLLDLPKSRRERQLRAMMSEEDLQQVAEFWEYWDSVRQQGLRFAAQVAGPVRNWAQRRAEYAQIPVSQM
jgi:hypothetical protein